MILEHSESLTCTRGIYQTLCAIKYLSPLGDSDHCILDIRCDVNSSEKFNFALGYFAGLVNALNVMRPTYSLLVAVTILKKCVLNLKNSLFSQCNMFGRQLYHTISQKRCKLAPKLLREYKVMRDVLNESFPMTLTDP